MAENQFSEEKSRALKARERGNFAPAALWFRFFCRLRRAGLDILAPAAYCVGICSYSPNIACARDICS
jgi:hypothetical protein